MLSVSDLTCAFAPITIFLVRIANFVNDELWGRVTDVPWAMVFPRGGPLPRHPSQLYEAALEGLVLLVIVQVALRVFRAHQKPGLISAIFLAGYGLFRFICEFFREPDTQFIGPISMGMALSIPIWIGAGLLLWIVSKRPRAA
jgi:phosphatidylglycerol:prolipoprotein diacylglycerol transferase